MADLAVFMRLFLQRRGWLLFGAALMLTTLIASFGLLSLSGWFITASAIAGLGLGGASAIGFDIFRPGAGIRFFAILRTGSRYAERLATHEATFRVLADLRIWLFRQCLPLDARQLGSMRSGDVLNRLTSDVDALDSLYLRVMAPTVVAVVMALVAVVFLGMFDPAIALVSVGLLALSGAAVPILANRLGDATGRRMVARAADLRTDVVDGIQGVTELKLFGAERRQRRRIDAVTADLVSDQRRMAQITGFSSALSQVLANFAVWSVLFIGLARHSDGSISAPILVMMVLATMALFEAFAPLPLAYQYLGKTRAAASRLLQIARQEPSIRDPDQPLPPPPGNALAFHGVTFGYDPRHPVIRNLSLSIAAGEKVALLGPSGVGKSTLISLALRLEDPQSGRILLGGTDIARLDREIVWGRMAHMSQRSQIFAGTIRDNLYLGNPTAEDAQLYAALAAANLDGFVSDLPDGLDTWVGENGMMISGGQARRLALARVILKGSPVLLLDEPTEGLDDATKADLFDRLMPVMTGCTVLTITHQHWGLDRFDRVLTLGPDGRVA